MNNPKIKEIYNRVKNAANNSDSVSFHANDSVEQFLESGDIDVIQNEAQIHVQNLLEALIIDTENDHNTQDTAKRVAKMLVREIFVGRYEPMPKVTAFPNAKEYDQMYVSGPIKIRSTCAHHLMPILGKCWVGIKPGAKVIGLSKFNRMVDWISSRPQIQEEMTEQIADIIEEYTEPAGVAVVIKAEHLCMTHRGVREHESDMTTSVMRGEFRTDSTLRNEFLNLMNNMKGHG